MKTKPGLYVHYKGGRYNVLGEARVSTNGPDEGKSVVVYVSPKDGEMYVRDSSEFNEYVGRTARFTFDRAMPDFEERLRCIVEQLVPCPLLIQGAFVAVRQDQIKQYMRATIATVDEMLSAISIRLSFMDTANDYLRSQLVSRIK